MNLAERVYIAAMPLKRNWDYELEKRQRLVFSGGGMGKRVVRERRFLGQVR
ncbi:MAG: hypothetical protein AAGE59_37475 [Cyanobacteria bacterium P01_F01_bin.86]